eukprot:13416947-Alexandrium_andersonii.AAC.1
MPTALILLLAGLANVCLFLTAGVRATPALACPRPLLGQTMTSGTGCFRQLVWWRWGGWLVPDHAVACAPAEPAKSAI